MAFFATIKTTYSIIQQSFGLIREHKRLLIFPALTTLLFSIGVITAFSLLERYSAYLPHEKQMEMANFKAWCAVSLFMLVFLFCLFFTCMGVAISHTTLQILQGRKPSLTQSIKKTFSRPFVLIRWALLCTLIWQLLQLLKSHKEGKKPNPIAAALANLLQLSWDFSRFFVIPIFAVENLGVIASLKHSTTLLRTTWGQTATALFSFALIQTSLLFTFCFLFSAIAAFFKYTHFLEELCSPILLSVGILLVFLLACIQTAQTIFKTISYCYATGLSTGAFSQSLLKQSFASKH
jgi:hypothetical protein